jgi:serine/threonine-protein kinase HipA
MKELLVLLDGRDVGQVRQKNGRLSFTYDDTWRNAEGAYPLSLSMPLAAAEHPHAVIDTFLWGLLPDNELVLSRWAKKFQASPRNAFALISHVGEDCAGAVQFVSQERREELANNAPAETDWLTEADVATRLRALQADESAGRSPRDTGQFSLAGAQPKTALLFDGQRWGVPSGRTPTTHILKPPTSEFDGHAENEHLCLSLAQALRLPTANSKVQKFENTTAIVIERFDRVSTLGPSDKTDGKTNSIYRVHQEDMCQALKTHPSLKYQNEGGPGSKEIIELMRTNNFTTRRGGYFEGRYFSTNYFASPHFGAAVTTDVATFIDGLIFNWLIGGTDGHAKNYSILMSGVSIRLAPFYDIASIFAYPDIDPRKAKMAMKIGDRYDLMEISFSDWRKTAKTLRVDGDALIDRIQIMARELPDRLSDEIRRMNQAGLNHRVIPLLAKALTEQSAKITSM